MRALRRLLALLLLVVMAAPASAQMFDNVGRGRIGAGSRGIHMGRGGGYVRRGGGRGLGLLPGFLLPAIAGAAAAEREYDEVRPPRRRLRPQRHPIAEPVEARPHRQFAHRPAVEPPPTPPPSSGLARTPPKGETRLAEDEVLVLMRDDGDERALRAFGRRQRLDFVQSRKLTLIGKTVHRFRITDGRDLRWTLRRAARDPRVVWVQPDYHYRLQEEAAKAQEPAQDAPKPETAWLEPPPGAYAGRALNLPQAHKIATGAGVRVAVIDSLVDAAHPEIDGAVADRFDAVESAGPEPQAHGTSMAGAISGHKKLDGAAPRAKLLAVRAFGDRGDASRGVSLDIAAGIDWAAAKGAKVVNMSFAGPHDPLLAEMLAAAAKKGLILIAAAGNDGPQAAPLYPAAYPEVVAVSAVDEQARVYDKAGRGSYVTLAAPGVDVLVAAPNGAYDLSTGTSIACAEVSGIVALLLEKRPGLDAAALRKLLRETSRALAGQEGLGEADALAAVVQNRSRTNQR